MNIHRRVVFDTSTLVGAALKVGSPPHRALLHAVATSDVCASPQTWMELNEVMQRPRLDRFMDRSTRMTFVAILRQHMRFFPVSPEDESAVQPACRDTRDNKFLALARVCRADVLISSDDDLLVLHPWCGMPVLRAAEFLARS
ncbi:MAG: putative toxin-antitoxin system toxin component, PIN family [Rhodoferax sp.]|jgi:putative PIN family toxin of toxin-antitoxin system